MPTLSEELQKAGQPGVRDLSATQAVDELRRAFDISELRAGNVVVVTAETKASTTSQFGWNPAMDVLAKGPVVIKDIDHKKGRFRATDKWGGTHTFSLEGVRLATEADTAKLANDPAGFIELLTDREIENIVSRAISGRQPQSISKVSAMVASLQQPLVPVVANMLRSGALQPIITPDGSIEIG